MIPGHPFFTEELDGQRRMQRLVLAGIPERVLEAAGAHRAKTGPPEPSGRVETTLRRLAESRIATLPTKVLEDIALPIEKDVLLAWAREVDLSRSPNQVVEMVSEETRASPDDERVAAQLVRRHEEELTRLAALLVWSDDLADDYVDPRIKAWRQGT